ncbi:MAG TPA: SpoIIE family protein phosphatase [Acidobacteriaceae bacterium]|nr:SpoIIE family protein phosphatase [Acidobacteriaceae bacterium]
MRKRALVFLLLLAGIAPRVLRAQSAASPQPTIRYHYGDNPAWASSSFDDSSWAVAVNGQLPGPRFHSDGFFWIRARIPVPSGLAGPLGVQTLGAMQDSGVEQVFVDGVPVGQYGKFPPHVEARLASRTLTFPVPAGMVRPGATALVAVRAWSSPISRISAGPIRCSFAIDRLSVLDTAARSGLATALLATLPPLIPSVLLLLLGIALLVIFGPSASRELRLNALWLIALPLYLIADSLITAKLVSPFVTAREWSVFFIVILIPSFWITAPFLWTVFGFRDRLFRAFAHATWMVFVAGLLLTNLAQHPDSWVPPLNSVAWVSLTLFNVICLGADLCALFVVRRNRTIAAVLSLINITYLLDWAGLPLTLYIGPVAFHSQLVAFVIVGVTITAMLVHRAVTGWRTSQRLQAEFAAAREVQQRLVPTVLPQIHYLRLRAAYIPAAEVGGDFYQVLPQSDGSALVVVGDVSGKGLKAAMTGTLVLGALQALSQETLAPAQVLSRLNAQLVASSDGSFVTCLCARIARDGALTLANAGHLPPYRNGEEIPLESALPLGVAPHTACSESIVQLAAGDSLTFLSDGVVEAQSATGELFGFDRTRAISSQSAEEIARAASTHGQQDDITVLTVTFAPVEVIHA